MTVKNGIRLLLTDNEIAKNKETIKYLKEILNILSDSNDFMYTRELIRNTINTLEKIAKNEFIDY